MRVSVAAEEQTCHAIRIVAVDSRNAKTDAFFSFLKCINGILGSSL